MRYVEPGVFEETLARANWERAQRRQTTQWRDRRYGEMLAAVGCAVMPNALPVLVHQVSSRG